MAKSAGLRPPRTGKTRYNRRRSDRVWRIWRWSRRLLLAGLVLCSAVLLTAAIYAAGRLLPDRPIINTDPESHFKYGSIGSERAAGIPFWIWRALPRVCADLLPGSPEPDRPYASLGLIYEPGRTLPVGMSQRRYLGIDLVGMNCALCHVGQVREKPQDEPRVIAGMPANTVDLMGLQRFLRSCAADPRFSAQTLIPVIGAMAGGLDFIDRYLVYPLAVPWARDRLLSRSALGLHMERRTPWGRGRMDTFSEAKIRFGFTHHTIPPEQRVGVVDPPSLWLQQQREGMHLNWDGNNDSVLERSRACALNTGPPLTTLDLAALRRVESWLQDLPPPDFPFPVDQRLAQRGRALYQSHCAGCHGASGRDFGGERVGTVVPIAEAGTDRWRLDAYTHALAVNQATERTGEGDARFTRFRKTFGYAAPPLDGIWLRAPYLHNGSVPTLRDLLQPEYRRPQQFYRGNDRYDSARVGFVSAAAREQDRRFSLFDTDLPGNGNAGHEGPAFGTDLAPEDKEALVEYLKSF